MGIIIMKYIILFAVFVISVSADWFNDIVEAQKTIVNKQWPSPAGLGEMSLLEACVGDNFGP